MLYIVLMPVKAGETRRMVFIKANSFREVRVMLRLSETHTSWASVTDSQLTAIMQSPEHYHTEFIQPA